MGKGVGAVWLTDFREAHGLSVAELGAVIRRVGARMDPPLRVSDVLLENLEMRKGYRTVPKLANLIAEVCGATAKQRDALVLKKHRGKWTPKPGATWMPPEPEKPKPPEPPKESAKAWCRPVVCLNRAGNAMRRFPSIQAAAELMGTSKDNVARRVMHRFKADEFGLLGYTFRLEEEWKAMSAEERAEDLRRAGENGVRPTPQPGTGRGGPHRQTPVTVIKRDGQVLHYKNVTMAAWGTHVGHNSIYERLKAGTPYRNQYLDGNMYMYTSMWEMLSEEEREKLRKG